MYIFIWCGNIQNCFLQIPKRICINGSAGGRGAALGRGIHTVERPAEFRGTPLRYGQVTKDNRAKADIAWEEKDVPVLKEESVAWVKAAQQYLRRERPEDEQEGGSKRRRVKSLEFLLAADNQLQTMTGRGLEDFQVPAEREKRDHPGKWHVLTLAMDQGPDGWSAFNFLKSRHLCFLVLRDPAHRRWNDTRLALKDCGLYSVVTLFCCLLNSDHAPWGECRWFFACLGRVCAQSSGFQHGGMVCALCRAVGEGGRGGWGLLPVGTDPTDIVAHCPSVNTLALSVSFSVAL